MLNLNASANERYVYLHTCAEQIQLAFKANGWTWGDEVPSEGQIFDRLSYMVQYIHEKRSMRPAQGVYETTWVSGGRLKVTSYTQSPMYVSISIEVAAL